MDNYNDKALVELLKDLYKAEVKKSTRYLIINYILAATLLLAAVTISGLMYELSSYDTITITETTTTEEYSNNVDGG